ncbi:Prophage CP4-57 integrase [Ruegeria denitrificans]|uniref:Prophage CP4-57 integrase n=1 Tax=Ruegeria denitrificans TaxID=1715692 RepID=A0A0P1IJF7_9RHOB|nr:integrase arm-type DNA-binding domain-containing protein [Ruegeria denitrificans]CUK16855.1 Prophage CP4-57 integrase [Ruegeria denitrificans]
MPLSDMKIRNLKPEEKPYKVSDQGGLYIAVQPHGSKLWRLKYRYKGREKTMSYGPYPLISLKEAREKRDRDKRLILDGQDPGVRKQMRKRAAVLSDEDTFAAFAAELLEKNRREGKASQTLKKKAWLIDQANEGVGHRPVKELRPADVFATVKPIEDAGKRETAGRVLSVIGEVCRYAIATGVDINDPTYALRGALQKKQVAHRAAILNPKRLGELLAAIDAYGGHIQTKLGAQLLAILHVRPGELRQAKWPEFNLEEYVWTVPRDRMKMRRDHRAPLPAQAIEILQRLRPLSQEDGYVLPGVADWKKPLSSNTFNNALRRMGFAKEEVSAHGFRSTFTTLATESGLWSIDAIERALSHEEENKTRRAYLRGDFWDERVRMAEWWANKLDELQLVATDGQ